MGKCKVVICGGGFAGLSCVRQLKKYNSNFSITLVDTHNHHLFQPMLYQVATGLIPINNVAVPFRAMLDPKYISFYQDTVQSVCRESKKVVGSSRSYDYDFLVICTGSKYTFYGNHTWSEHVFVLKSASDALQMRNHIFNNFEKAESSSNPEEVKNLLSFCIIGGGPTGVEIAGAIHEITNSRMFKRYKSFGPKDVTITLIESADSILKSFPLNLIQHAEDELRSINVTLSLGEKVLNIDEGIVCTDAKTYKAATIIWSAGVEATPAAEWLGITAGKSGRAPVDEYLQSQELGENIFVAGDVSEGYDVSGECLPGLASVAKQQGVLIAKNIRRKASNKPLLKFKYKNYGSMAIISHNSAVADFGVFTLK